MNRDDRFVEVQPSVIAFPNFELPWTVKLPELLFHGPAIVLKPLGLDPNLFERLWVVAPKIRNVPDSSVGQVNMVLHLVEHEIVSPLPLLNQRADIRFEFRSVRMIELAKGLLVPDLPVLTRERVIPSWFWKALEGHQRWTHAQMAIRLPKTKIPATRLASALRRRRKISALTQDPLGDGSRMALNGIPFVFGLEVLSIKRGLFHLKLPLQAIQVNPRCNEPELEFPPGRARKCLGLPLSDGLALDFEK